MSKNNTSLETTTTLFNLATRSILLSLTLAQENYPCQNLGGIISFVNDLSQWNNCTNFTRKFLNLHRLRDFGGCSIFLQCVYDSVILLIEGLVLCMAPVKTSLI